MKGLLIVIVIVGIIIGGGIYYALTTGFNNPFTPQAIVQAPLTSTPTPRPPEDTKLQDEAKKREELLGRLRTRFFEEGISVSANVVDVFDGVGFTITDDEGTTLFIEWDKTLPKEGEKVVVKGTVKKVSEELPALKRKPGFTPELESFLKTKNIFIKATDVTLKLQ